MSLSLMILLVSLLRQIVGWLLVLELSVFTASGPVFVFTLGWTETPWLGLASELTCFSPILYSILFFSIDSSILMLF